MTTRCGGSPRLLSGATSRRVFTFLVGSHNTASAKLSGNVTVNIGGHLRLAHAGLIGSGGGAGFGVGVRVSQLVAAVMVLAESASSHGRLEPRSCVTPVIWDSVAASQPAPGVHAVFGVDPWPMGLPARLGQVHRWFAGSRWVNAFLGQGPLW